MKNNDRIQNGGIGFVGLLTLVFITLKLIGVIDWSWWAVLSPVLLPAAAIVVIFVILTFYYVLKGTR